MNNGEPMCKALVINEKCPPNFLIGLQDENII